MKPFLAFLLAGLLYAQPDIPPNTCRISGAVVNSVTGSGVRYAKVTLTMATRVFSRENPTGQLTYSTNTDSEGRFVASGIQPGAYRVTAERAGFERSDSQQAEFVNLTAAEEKKGLQVRLAPLAAISGRVRDRDDFPVRDVQVSLLSWQYTTGGKTLRQVGITTTNDLGQYRIFDISHGKYLLRLTPGKGSTVEVSADEAYGAVYYPGAPDASGAELIEIEAGRQITGIDALLPRQRAVAIRGKVLRPLGSTFSSVSLTQEVAGWSQVVMGSVIPNDAGAFEFRGVAPGRYRIHAQARLGDASYSTSRWVLVGVSDIEGLELKPGPPGEVRGAAKIEGTSRNKISTVNVSLRGQNGTLAYLQPGGMGEDGSFVLRNVEPDVYQASILGPGDLYLKSFKCGDTEIEDLNLDLTDTTSPCPLSLVFSANGAQIRGKVMLDAGVTLSHKARVTLTPTDSKRPDTVFRYGLVSAKGDFNILGVAPGSYRIVAWDDVDLNAARYDPTFLKGYESAGQSIRIYEGVKPEEVTLNAITKRRPE